MKNTINQDWTLFLDRDGVINKKLEGDYIKNLEEFEFEEGVLDLLSELNDKFGRIIVVTNQQGIGKKLMTEEDLKTIHRYMTEKITKAGGRIDGIYFAPQKSLENSIMRKPGIGMALEAKNDFPEIDFSKSIMVGDSPTDIEMGKKCGMKTIFLHHQRYELADQVAADFSVNKFKETKELLCG